MAHTPANYDISIWKGNDEEFAFHFYGEGSGPPDFDLTGSTLVFNAKWSSTGNLEQNLDIDADPTTGLATLSLTVEQTRTLPTTKTVNYEIERRIGATTERTLLYGVVTVNGGNNTDG